MVAAHAMNDRSSRSHAIVTLWIEMTVDGEISCFSNSAILLLQMEEQ